MSLKDDDIAGMGSALAMHISALDTAIVKSTRRNASMGFK